MKRILIIVAAFIPLLLNGQNDIQLSQQFLSRVNYNPAATGASNYIQAFLIGRQQWLGMRQAPSTQVLNAHSYFNPINSGIGLSVVNDKLGYESSIMAKLGYAYYIHFEKSYLSFGLGGGILYKSLDKSGLRSEVVSDPVVDSYIDKSGGLNPDFDFGIEFNTEQFQIGASVTHLNRAFTQLKKLKYYETGRHIYFYTKYTFNLGLDWKLAPAFIAQMSEWPIMQLDVNTMVTYRERFWGGASFRFNDKFVAESIVGIVGLYVTDFLGLGYSYDFNPGPLKKYSSGSHEISLRVRIGRGDSGGGGKSPRFFE
ncbi:MAG: type IX secretion system membrane protein PorP/SprF [Prevotellaceae bacterium]|nr:type IX secretion system membrane protein PorP/SprF [Prevotellaceae bacterium]